jgi:hypothetical protein
VTATTIRPARESELETLRAIEMDAVGALIEAGVPFPGEPHPLSLEQLGSYLTDGLLIVAAVVPQRFMVPDVKTLPETSSSS